MTNRSQRHKEEVHGVVASKNWTTDVKQYFDPTVPALVVGSPVVDVKSPDTKGFAIGPRFQQTVTTSSRPTSSGGRIVFDGVNDFLEQAAGSSLIGEIYLPDAAYSEAGKGFACTGLCRVANGTWWVGHYGKKSEGTAGSETFNTSVLHLTADFQTILEEIRCTEDMGIATVAGIQGVAVDAAAGVLYFADLVRLYGVNLATKAIVLNIAKTAGGLAFNTLTDELIAWTSSATVARVNKVTGANIGTFTLREGNDRDHLFFDPTYGSAGALYSTSRLNGTAGRVVKYDYASMTPLKAWAFTDVRCIEGLSVVGDRIYMCNDSYYHNTGAIFLNRISYADVDKSTPDYGTRLVIAGVAKVAATPAGDVSLVHGGDAVNLKGVGLLFTNVANQFKLQFRGSGAAYSGTYALASATTEFIYCLDIDTVAHTAELRINGTLLATLTDPLIAGSIPSLVWTIAAYYGTSAIASLCSATTQGGLIVSTDAQFKQEFEGKLAWQTGNQGKLPLNHKYKDAAPV
jgi:hypothetical protein